MINVFSPTYLLKRSFSGIFQAPTKYYCLTHLSTYNTLRKYIYLFVSNNLKNYCVFKNLNTLKLLQLSKT